MPKKVAGARWEGKKTILAESDEEEEQQQQEEEEQEQHEGVQTAGMPVDTTKYVVTVKNGITIVMPRSKLGQASASGKEDTQQQQQQQQQQEQMKQQKSKGKKRKQEQQQQQVVKATKVAAGGSAGQGAAAGAQQAAPTTPAAAAGGASGSSKGKKGDNKVDKKVKWGKLAQRILANAPKRRMKLAKLRQQVLEAAGLAGAAAEGGVAGGVEGAGQVAEQQMVKKLRKSSSFVVGEKYVTLADAA
jgi:hypothetical protein